MSQCQNELFVFAFIYEKRDTSDSEVVKIIFYAVLAMRVTASAPIFFSNFVSTWELGSNVGV